jgi:hypothetical protein
VNLSEVAALVAIVVGFFGIVGGVIAFIQVGAKGLPILDDGSRAN